MKIFISWSGERSKKVAELLDSWIQCVIQAVTPWISCKDIDKGSLWFSEISNNLAETCVGIICITSDNKNEPWILFEAGALAKGINSNRVCTFLIDVQHSDIGGPLAQFNHTFPDRESIFSLVSTINNSLGEDALKQQVLERVFDTYWPQFESQFRDIIENTPVTHSKSVKRDNVQIMDEILSAVRSMDRRLRDVETQREKPEIRDRPSSLEVRHKIRLLTSMGMSPDEIRGKLRNEYPSVPIHWIDRQLTLLDDKEQLGNIVL